MTTAAGSFRTIDLHTHAMPPGMAAEVAATGDPRWPRLEIDDGGDSGTVLRGDDVFRVVRPATWDMAVRLREMDSLAVDCHIISPIPVSLAYWAEPELAIGSCRFVNDWTAASVADAGGRLLGLGIVPLQDPAAAVREMDRALDELGLVGIEIGTVVGGRELDHPELRPFFRAAAGRGAPLFLHPTDRKGAARCSSPLQEFGVGMLTDTALAASSLVFGGVLAELPDLRVCLSHGGGALPWMYPRLKAHATARGLASAVDLDELLARFYVDSLVFDPEHLSLLRSRVGLEHVVLGSDFPFLPLHPAPQEILERAVDSGITSAAEARAIRGPNALEFLCRT